MSIFLSNCTQRTTHTLTHIRYLPTPFRSPGKGTMASQTIIATVGEILVEFVSHKTNCALEKVADYSGPYPSGAPAIFLDQAALMGSKDPLL